MSQVNNYPSTEQSQAVQNGTFTDMYVGDYWVINGKTRRIGDIELTTEDGFVDTFIGPAAFIITKEVY